MTKSNEKVTRLRALVAKLEREVKEHDLRCVDASIAARLLTRVRHLMLTEGESFSGREDVKSLLARIKAIVPLRMRQTVPDGT
jgi:hypothetical protein